MKKFREIATVLVRLALGAGFLSAVASRLSLWGSYSSGWQGFLLYTARVNSFAPINIIPLLSIASTILETLLGVALLIGYKTRWAALSAAILTLLFAIAMSASFGIKEPLDYSVFSVCTGAFYLSTAPFYKYSIDEKLMHDKFSKQQGKKEFIRIKQFT
jgi:putative oxidoreductase